MQLDKVRAGENFCGHSLVLQVASLLRLFAESMHENRLRLVHSQEVLISQIDVAFDLLQLITFLLPEHRYHRLVLRIHLRHVNVATLGCHDRVFVAGLNCYKVLSIT